MADPNNQASSEGFGNDGFFFKLELASMDGKLQKNDGTVVNVRVFELSGKKRDAWMNKLVGLTKVDPSTGKAIGLKRVDGIQTGVLKDALFNLDDETYFSEAELNGFPNRVLEKLGNWVIDKSGLDGGDKGNDEAENVTNGDD